MSSATLTLLPHALVTPLSTVATSAIPEGALAVIEWCVFDNISQLDAVQRYNDAGYGTINSHHGISKQLMRFGGRWYAEQGAVSPWKCKKEAEKKELRARGLGKTDFPFVHPRDLPGSQARICQAQQQQSGGAGAKVLFKAKSKPTLPFKKLIVKLRAHIPPGHIEYVPRIPDNLKKKILAKHKKWLKANTTGIAEIADPIEDELDKLERDAMGLSMDGFRAWKFGKGRYGHW